MSLTLSEPQFPRARRRKVTVSVFLMPTQVWPSVAELRLHPQCSPTQGVHSGEGGLQKPLLHTWKHCGLHRPPARFPPTENKHRRMSQGGLGTKQPCTEQPEIRADRHLRRPSSGLCPRDPFLLRVNHPPTRITDHFPCLSICPDARS